ncbi:aldehyde dehydrogenase [Tenacibaculum holothuriorum]|uniref:Aldehyde dehydrogenase n=1 Tax=Tenacibaculum holothuriorum TaxID=1635173 RepID=A0A1Y2PC15_9FLAO|nr:aldehyde dehydrogenase (NADP(+)) [Tenacibaculum holothuriorum]OSY87327.1 aldehyde dehydrogenase [Tenacibaculum holothuriorum]
MITGKNYIGNKLSGKGTITHRTINPKLNIENPYEFVQATEEEVEEAVALSEKAFQEYKNYSGKKKAIFLNTIADEILALGDELIQTYTSESGLPEGRAMGERGRTMNQLRAFANLLEEGTWNNSVIDTADASREPAPKPDIRRINIPLGPVVVFAASNFPLAFSTAGGDTASALAAGCPVIMKAHSMHAGTSELVASAIIKAAEKTGMPNGIFSNITGSGRVVGAALVKHPKVKAVGFTGSISGGKALCSLAANREEPIPVFAEMGSINPVIITPEAIAARGENIASTYAGSITLGAGQFCTNPGLLLTIKSDKTDDFINDLGKKAAEIESQCMLHPNIKRDFVANGNSVSAQAGVEVVSEIIEAVAENNAPTKIVKVSGEQFLENNKLHQEVFGPFSLVVVCDSKEELIEVVNGLEGQLTGTILAEESELSTMNDVLQALQNRVGRIIFNGVPTGVEVCAAMTHGGPFPASSDSRFTAVGVNSINRWVRPFSYQDFPDSLLPDELKNSNPLQILRLVDGSLTKDKIN